MTYEEYQALDEEAKALAAVNELRAVVLASGYEALSEKREDSAIDAKQTRVARSADSGRFVMRSAKNAASSHVIETVAKNSHTPKHIVRKVLDAYRATEGKKAG